MARILFDVSFTRTQHHPTGIPRTVERLCRALAQDAGEREFVPVAFHAGRWRRPRAWEAGTQLRPAGAPATGRPGGNASWWIDTAAPWLSARMPLPLRRLAVGTYHRWLFDRLSRNDEPVAPRSGDILLLADASWNYEVWRAACRVRDAGGRVVLMVHDIMPVRHPEFCSAVFRDLFVRWLRRVLAASDAVLCNSRTTEEDLRDWAASSRIALPPTGHFRLGHDAAAKPAPGDVRLVLESFMNAGVPCFASIGTFEPKKNYGFLLDTFENLWSQGLPVRLVVAGRPTAQCEQLVMRYRSHPEQGKRLMTLFDATDAEIGHIYRHCRALVLASQFEGFGLPLVEARTQGCAVIASDLTAFRELADAGVFLYPQGSAVGLEALLRQHSQSAMGASAPPMRPFTWGDSAAQCIALCQRLLSGRAQPASA
jgi:glycosyltransferase involved in cell wall biosynthesis